VDLQFVPDLMALHTSRMRLKEIGGILGLFSLGNDAWQSLQKSKF